MKALREAKELLVDVKIDVEKEGAEQFGYIETKLEIIIAELEALQQPKQCNTCSFYHSYTGVCANDKCPLCADFVDAYFGCIYHEVKEQ